MNDIIVPATPRLPNATTEYDRMAQEQYSNVLRLFFNQLVNALGQIVASSSNNESTTSADFLTQVARGKVDGASQVNIFAYSEQVKITYYTLWELTGTTQ